MKKIKKILALFLISLIAILGISCGDSSKKTVKIGISTPDDEIWDALKKKAKEDYNIEVETVCFSNVNINQVLADKDIDLNAFQHHAYFDQNIKDLGLDLTPIGDTYILRLDLYSKKYASPDELPTNSKIAVPNDPVNLGRSLKVFEKAGLITLKDNTVLSPTIKDIESNPKNIEIIEIEHSQIVHSLDDVDAGIIFVKDAVDGKLDPSKDPIFKDNINLKDDKDKPYINLIACRTEDKDNETYKNVVKAFNSEEVAQAIENQFKHAAVPAWDEKYASY